MTTVVNLLHTAYVHIDAGNSRHARSILESLLNVDPMNVEAWEAYMQISGTREELDHLCDRVLQFTELNPADRESILDYYYFLRQKMRSCSADAGIQKMITFELMDQFTYNLKDVSSTNSDNATGTVSAQRSLAWFLDKAIFIVYLVLLVIGLELLAAGNDFGYWIIIVLGISIFVSMWNKIFLVAKTDHVPNSRQSDTLDILEDTAPDHLI